jgi:hypothetical protein
MDCGVRVDCIPISFGVFGKNPPAGHLVIKRTPMDSCVTANLDERQELNDARRATEVRSANSRADDINDATPMLAAIEAGDCTAAEQLLTLVYDELRRLAASKLAREDPGQTLQATALVHEVWLNLVGDRNPSFKDRAHFFRASAEAMRHILIDRSRRKKSVRHGGGYRRIDFQDFALT